MFQSMEYAVAPDIALLLDYIYIYIYIYIYLLLSFIWYFLCFSASNGNYPFSLGVYIHLLCVWISQHLVNMNWCWCFKIRYSNFLCSRVDLCHRATDHEEEGEDDEQTHIASSLIHSQASKSCCHCTWCILMLQHIQG